MKSMQTEIMRLQTDLENANQRASNAEASVEALKNELKKIKEKNTAEVKQVKEKNTALDNKLNETKTELFRCIETVEDNKNRQLRKTLVFWGISEMKFPNDQNKNRKESWEEKATCLNYGRKDECFARRGGKNG